MSVSIFNPLSDNPTKWPNTFEQFVRKLPTNCLSVFDHFVKLGLKGLMCLGAGYIRLYFFSRHSLYVEYLDFIYFNEKIVAQELTKRIEKIL